jgi:hypothetical protein
VPTVAELAAALLHHGYGVPAGLHLVALRKRNGTTDAFDDMLCVVDGDKRLAVACRCTTDPGLAHRQKPMNAAGCAVWAVGQVVDGMGCGKHKGEYPCLVPVKPIPVLRYSSVADITGTPSTSRTTQIHRASSARESTAVGAWSAGCIVVANPDDFAKVMEACRASRQTRFTVTLLDWS